MLRFQVIDWNYFHEEEDENDKKYKIRLFGRTRENKTIYVKVNKFFPYFYIKLDNDTRREKIKAIINNIQKRVFPKPHIDGLMKYEVEEKCDLYGFTNYSKFNFLKMTFYDYESFKSYERAIEKTFKNKKFKIYEANIEPILRSIHEKNLESVGWIELNDYENTDNVSWCDINIECDYDKLNYYECRDIMPFEIASFDIECVSEDGSFPQPERDFDQVIQIGTTFSRFGENDCYYRHIITLGKCKKKKYDFDIECYDDEKQVLLAWVKLLERTNPDIITGYNILGFDFEYLMKRAKKLNIENEFSKLSRIRNEKCLWKEQKLASSALGDNILKYYEMTGRVIIDLMKVVQRDFKLASYKLDYVAQSFIKESITKLEYIEETNETIIHTKNIYGVQIGQSITVMYNDSITDNAHMDGQKFEILNLEPNKITVQNKIDDDIMSMGYRVSWCQAKDDISPRDIFEFQKKSRLDKRCNYRSLIAKYCIQDCQLENKLIAKLQVLTNNIGMANVCSVPLSYLFKRGQGIKIQSVVAKKCREDNHLIPVLKKPNKDKSNKNAFELIDGELLDNFVNELNQTNDLEEEDEDNKYEGAIVFPPKKGVYFEPIPVLDYNSLYPSSMIQRNTSHECNILNPEYDEKYGYLKDYNYHEITYTNVYDFTEIYKEFKKLNQYIDFFRLIMTSFVPNIKFDYSDVFDEETETNNISYSYKKRNDEDVEDTLLIADDRIRDNIKYILKDSYKNIGAVIKIIILNIKKIYKQCFDTELDIINNKDKKCFQIYNNIFRKRRLWIEISYILGEEKIKITKVCKFAEKADGTKGIIPQILIGLLNARKRIKNEMEEEKDKFKQSILDGLQLAYKCTANSLYGATGAPVSPIYMKDIAASTTATGREMLYFSRYFVEEKFGKLINLALRY